MIATVSQTWNLCARFWFAKPAQGRRRPEPIERRSRSWSDQKILRNPQNRKPASIIDAGSVNTQAISRLRTVAHCNPE